MKIVLFADSFEATTVIPAKRFVDFGGNLSQLPYGVWGVNRFQVEVDQEGTVDVSGILEVEAGAAIVPGEIITTDTQGRAIPWVAGQKVGRAITIASGAGDFVEFISLSVPAVDAPITVPADRILSGVTTAFPITVGGNNVVITNVTSTNVNGNAINATNVSNLTVRDTFINNPNGRGINLSGITANLSITNTRITSSQSANAVSLANTAGTLALNLTGNAFTNTGFHGFNVAATGTAIITGTIQENVFSNNAVHGVQVQTSNTSSTNFVFQANQFNANLGYGALIGASAASTNRSSWRNNQISGNNGKGLFINRQPSDAGTASLPTQVIDNAISGNVNDLEIRMDLPGTICLDMDSNTIGQLILNNSGAGTFQVEGALPGTNTISNTTSTGTITTVAASTCGFP